MKGEGKPTTEAYFNRYLLRAIRRIIKVIFFLFILFIIIVLIIWAAPKMLGWALG